MYYCQTREHGVQVLGVDVRSRERKRSIDLNNKADKTLEASAAKLRAAEITKRERPSSIDLIINNSTGRLKGYFRGNFC
jgi:hypothetical protein